MVVSALRISTLSVDVEDRWDDNAGIERYTVILMFGSAEVARWPVVEPDSRWRTGYGYGDEERQAVAEEFVAARLAAALADPS